MTMSDSTSDTAADRATLAADGDQSGQLQRVSFSPGVMLGAEALAAEQDYHRRRLNRHQRWITGTGTVFGLAVGTAPGKARANGQTDVTLSVAPGYALDGLGREIVVGESYVVSLLDWLTGQRGSDPASLESAFENGTLHLLVTARARAAPRGLTPTLVPVFDAAIDPVVPSRIGDSFLLELLPDRHRKPDAVSGGFGAWTADHATPASGDIPGPLSQRETDLIAAAADAGAQAALRLQAWLLQRGFPNRETGPGAEDAIADAARIVLCSVHVALAAPDALPAPADVSVNNLVRPFVRPNALLAPLPPPA